MTEHTVDTLLRDAMRQLVRRFATDETIDQAGIVAFDLSKVINPRNAQQVKPAGIMFFRAIGKFDAE